MGIQMMSRLRVCDNSGAKVVQVIQVLGKKSGGTVGDVCSVSVKSADSSSRKVKKGEVCHALIVRHKREKVRYDGSFLRTSDTACILLHQNGQPLGTRIRGVVSAALDRQKWLKVISLCRAVI
mmetsp:Transcript_17823/g.38605  ORF Transcript_17823/g.38605 Transcript_17823/m.38605 type:complete len:123 (-) Transcript_17823:633-1001(-)|eukprot:CAMPEP_0185858032 /NCGR_PEP_ID=MMETSP1354-20130828/29808_1 /TAXON_ID=708628 /ORGANISM="Erythrolobus madagascarensis, Strain CCMP3276" /LENGTH=122 /DNA_ID=CAMNT_0028560311 /DNA_START=176 /DNA_END=544 /DNA_ORIENTATION=+